MNGLRRRLTRLSLRNRLFVMILAPLVLVASVSGIARYFQFSALSTQIYDNTLYSVALTISRDVTLNQGDMLTPQLLEALTSSLGDQIFYHVTGPDGAYVTGYTNPPPLPARAQLRPGRPVFFDAEAGGQQVRALRLVEYYDEARAAGMVTVDVWQTVHQRRALSLTLIGQTVLNFGFLVETAALLIWFTIRSALRPLSDLESAILARSPDDLQPIRRWVPRELKTLVGATNALFARLTQAFAQRDAFISDAAHQMRNPIAAIQAQAEAALSAPNEAVLRARVQDLAVTARRTGRLTNQLLSLERVRGRRLRNTVAQVDAVEILAETTRVFAERAMTAGHEVSFDILGKPRPIAADPVLLAEMLTNLLENAQAYGPRGGEIAVQLSFDPASLRIVVSDQGPGIPAAMHERVFDRFFRLQADTAADRAQGCGLGLAIVRDIAQTHGGQARVLPAGFGAAIEVRLPFSGGWSATS